MDTRLDVATAWQRLRRQSLLLPPPSVARMPLTRPLSLPPLRLPQAANADDFRDGDAPFEAADTLPMLYRSEAFAEDLVDSHPQPAG